MAETGKFPIVERAVRWLIIMLLAEFVLGAVLMTVIGYSPNKHSGAQDVFLIAHVIVALALLVGSFAHILTSRHSRLLGPKPIMGFLCIVGALVSGSLATNGSNIATLLMALFFGAALVTYGLSYITVKTTGSRAAPRRED